MDGENIMKKNYHINKDRICNTTMKLLNNLRFKNLESTISMNYYLMLFISTITEFIAGYVLFHGLVVVYFYYFISYATLHQKVSRPTGQSQLCDWLLLQSE